MVSLRHPSPIDISHVDEAGTVTVLQPPDLAVPSGLTLVLDDARFTTGWDSTSGCKQTGQFFGTFLTMHVALVGITPCLVS